jgi:epoxyqueuosine reductase
MDKSQQLVDKAVEMGATLAGIAAAAALKHSPSYRVYGKAAGLGTAKSVLILALHHPEKEPELDWWGVPGGTAGNQLLKEISGRLKKWLQEALGIKARIVPYQPGQGGIFLKDAAVLAGIGILAANNLLLTPGYGPRVRLRALLLEEELPPTAPLEFAPCESCHKPCWQACPQKAFVSGNYSKECCYQQMGNDEDRGSQEGTLVKYCRACELSCPRR